MNDLDYHIREIGQITENVVSNTPVLVRHEGTPQLQLNTAESGYNHDIQHIHPPSYSKPSFARPKKGNSLLSRKVKELQNEVKVTKEENSEMRKRIGNLSSGREVIETNYKLFLKEKELEEVTRDNKTYQRIQDFQAKQVSLNFPSKKQKFLKGVFS